jgi:hypothetical protein
MLGKYQVVSQLVASGVVLSSTELVRLRLALSKRPNRVGAFLPSPVEGNTSSFRNVVLSSYLEFRKMDNVHTPSYSECYTPSSEPFTVYVVDVLKHLTIFSME